jgi:hypothetical protein
MAFRVCWVALTSGLAAASMGRAVAQAPVVTSRGVELPESVDPLIAWLRGVAADDVKYLVLKIEGGK